jgi:hypothetical protein
MQHGYWSFSDSGYGLSYTSVNKAIPGLVSIFLQASGPDQFLLTTGYNASAALPGLFEFPASPSEQFLSEIMVNAPNIENVTGGPQIQKGNWWDWLQSGAVSPTSATGVNDLARQQADNRTFYAGVAFGLSAAAVAAFAVEAVGARAESRRRRSGQPDHATESTA